MAVPSPPLHGAPLASADKEHPTRRRGSRRDAGGGAGTAASCSLSPWPLCLPWEGEASQMPLVLVCQTLQVEEQEQAQLPLDQTSWNKFASDSLLSGSAASAAE